MGSALLTVIGVGRGAVNVRYSLARLESLRIYHETITYVSYNGSVPSADEAQSLQDVGDWPSLPRRLKAVSGEFKDELDSTAFDDHTTGAANPGGPVITQQLGDWIIERMMA